MSGAWAEKALAGAVTEAIVIVDDEITCNLRWANNSLTTNGEARRQQATVMAFHNGAQAVLSGPVNSAEDVAALLRSAETQALSAAPTKGLQPLVAAGRADDYSLPAAAGGIKVLNGIATGLGDAFAEATDHLLFGFAEHTVTSTWLATSAGTRRRAVNRVGRFEFNAKSPDFVNSAWVGQQSVDFTDVDVAEHHAELKRRLTWGQRRVELPAGRYEVILPPSAVADLLIYTYWSAAGLDAREGRSVFAKLNSRFAKLPIRLYSDPQAPGLEQPPFAIVRADSSGLLSVRDNGAPIEAVDWIRDGAVSNLIEPRSAEHQLRFPTENLLCEAGGEGSVEEMIRATKKGLLLTCLWYIREVDPQSLLLTGLTRDGVYLIEDGEVVAMVNNFRFNESPIDLLRRATEASAPSTELCREWNDYFTKTSVPGLRVPDFKFSTVSRAY